MTDPPPITVLLDAWRHGDDEALDRLLPLVYEELRTLADRHLGGERAGHTLSATALVHEAYVAFSAGPGPKLSDRVHFFAIASRVMRRVLVWHARKRHAAKRGGGAVAITLEPHLATDSADLDAVIALDRAMVALEELDPRLCRVVECRHFGGLSVAETAEALGISQATVKRDWTAARAWLRTRLADTDSE